MVNCGLRMGNCELKRGGVGAFVAADRRSAGVNGLPGAERHPSQAGAPAPRERTPWPLAGRHRARTRVSAPRDEDAIGIDRMGHCPYSAPRMLL